MCSSDLILEAATEDRQFDDSLTKLSVRNSSGTGIASWLAPPLPLAGEADALAERGG